MGIKSNTVVTIKMKPLLCKGQAFFLLMRFSTEQFTQVEVKCLLEMDKNVHKGDHLSREIFSVLMV